MRTANKFQCYMGRPGCAQTDTNPAKQSDAVEAMVDASDGELATLRTLFQFAHDEESTLQSEHNMNDPFTFG